MFVFVNKYASCFPYMLSLKQESLYVIHFERKDQTKDWG